MQKLFLVLFLVAGVAYGVPTTLSIVNVSASGTSLADNTADTSNGDRVLNPGGDVFFIIRNTHASNSSTVTFVTPTAAPVIPGWGAVARASLAVTLAAGEVKHVGPFRSNLWNDTSGYVQLTYSGTGAVKVSPLRLVMP